MVVGDLATEVDVVVLGAGAGGCAAAVRAAQLGKEVVIVNSGGLGGTFLHEGGVGCQALLTAAERAWRLPHLVTMGVMVEGVKVDWAQMQRWKDGIVSRLSNGVQKRLEEHNVHIVKGKGWFIKPNEVRVEKQYGSERFIFEHAIIAVGADAAPLPGLPFDGQRILSPSQALRLEKLPKELTIVASDDAPGSRGEIAAELATLFAKLGVVVRLLIPAGQRLLNQFDPLAGRQVQTQLRHLGVKIKRNVKDLATNPAVEHAPIVVLCAELTPRTEQLALDVARVTTDQEGYILVNDRMQSHNPAIYAVGDVTGGPPLATLAIKQGQIAAETIAGLPTQYAPQAVPRVAWTHPQIASVGLTTEQAQVLGYQPISHRYPLAANARALTLNAPTGTILTVAEQTSQLLLGVTIIAPQANELITQAALAIEMGATLTDLAETLPPHPSLAHALQQSAEALLLHEAR
ncbi:MAG: dihydrolipoyl dehydrogenase family protein [Ardenticatenaceae bacterium]